MSKNITEKVASYFYYKSVSYGTYVAPNLSKEELKNLANFINNFLQNS